MRTVTYYVGMSLDGYIAAPDGSYDVFPVEQPLLDFIVEELHETLPSHVRAQLGVTAVRGRFDTAVMGRNTYAPALEAGITSPYAHLDQHVVSSTLPLDLDPQITVTGEDPAALLRRLKQQPGAGIWLAGGGRLAGAVLEEVDQLLFKRYPLVLGAGIPAIAAPRPGARPFSPVDHRTLADGTTVTTYDRTRST